MTVHMLLRFADAETASMPVQADQTVLEAAEAAGIALAYDCREGRCGTCAARSSAGERVLLCQLRPAEGAELSLPYSRGELFEPTRRRAKIAALEKVSASVWAVRLRLQFPLDFLPGQYVRFEIPGTGQGRNFSMANAPGEEFELYVRELPAGVMSGYLAKRARIGDIVELKGPYGRFYARTGAGLKVFVAGGTGLSPILSMLRTLAARGHKGRLTLAFGVTHAADVFALEEIEALKSRLNLTVALAAVNGRVGTPLAVGQLTGTAVDALGALLDGDAGDGDEAYVCGPPAMVTATREWLLRRCFSDTSVFNEEFAPA